MGAPTRQWQLNVMLGFYSAVATPQKFKTGPEKVHQLDSAHEARPSSSGY